MKSFLPKKKERERIINKNPEGGRAFYSNPTAKDQDSEFPKS